MGLAVVIVDDNNLFSLLIIPVRVPGKDPPHPVKAEEGELGQNHVEGVNDWVLLLVHRESCVQKRRRVDQTE